MTQNSGPGWISALTLKDILLFFFSCAITNYDNFYTLLAQRTDEKRYYKQSNLLATERRGLYYCSNAKQSIHPFSF